MGQLRSYNEELINRKLANVERELVAFKSTQDYGANQIMSRIISVPGAITTKEIAISYGNVYWIGVKIKFVGVNKNKVARGALSWTNNGQVYLWEILESSGVSQPNEMSWYLLVRGTANTSLYVTAYMNMNGMISYEWFI